ncbi:hypothetical protein [Flavobacterium hercynium]|uniref:Uncharacterized protein n=1 Tax=Flavobacterium hercynium TaxID=387094 RepID=A0A226HGW7_9FLAO|nr:hypothetical protein [Flavobacterium hercynium]OXA93507.1 hypothetical protein B0A66_06665 [Flavobacterium hercynium]SMP32128.1 hypothetical protein SAMN06265346_114119 [Flavobacterium hercynium]
MLNITFSQTEIINKIKLLIYTEDPEILTKVDIDDDTLFLEPLLFFYFNYKREEAFTNQFLRELMQGYFIKKEETRINHLFYETEITYLPKLGYFKKDEPEFFEPIEMIKDTNIEILKHSFNLLRPVFSDTAGRLISDSEITFGSTLFDKNISYLTNALLFIKEDSNEHFQLIEQCCKKILLFKTDPNITNSFSSAQAHGIAFLNVYQDEYDEVFFIDDIAHQTGHIILTTLLHDRKMIFIIDEEQKVEDLTKLNDHKTVYTLFHELYTYYAIFLCLDNSLAKNRFKKRQEKEVLGRIGFYLCKCAHDLDRFDIINSFYNGESNVLTDHGKEIFNLIREKYFEVSKKWQSITKEHHMLL